MSKGDISYYMDTLVVETILGDPSLVKRGGILSNAASMIKEYVDQHIDPNDKAGSVINMLAPAAITEIFSLFGWGKLGWLLGIGASVFHIDVASMVRPLWETVKNTLSKGHGVTPAQIDAVTANTIQQNTPADQSPADDITMDNRIAKDLRDARMLRLALEQYDHQMLRLTKEPPNFLFSYAAGKIKGSLIAKILGWIFKTVLISAGLMVAGDVGAKMLGMPNAIDKTYHAGQQPSGGPSAAPTPVTTQNKFKPTGTGTEAPPQPWSESVSNDPGSIENMLIGFTKDVYSGLDGHEGWIRSSPIFQAVKNQIVWFNQAAAGEPMVYIPQMYPNKKAIVDHYIDEVAKNAV